MLHFLKNKKSILKFLWILNNYDLQVTVTFAIEKISTHMEFHLVSAKLSNLGLDDWGSRKLCLYWVSQLFDTIHEKKSMEQFSLNE